MKRFIQDLLERFYCKKRGHNLKDYYKGLNHVSFRCTICGALGSRAMEASDERY